MQSIRTVLAEFTALFDWEALAAIGTVGALWFLAIETTRNARQERAKVEGILTFLIGAIEPVESVCIHEEEGARQLLENPVDLVDSDLHITQRALAAVETLPLESASSAGVVEWVMALPLALRDIETTLKTRRIDKYGNVFSSIRYVSEANQHFRSVRDTMRSSIIKRMFLL